MENFDLAQCPFCRSEKERVVAQEFLGKDFSNVFVRCSYCNARGPTDEDPDGAIDAWNACEKEPA